jgi:hypothetical protein
MVDGERRICDGPSLPVVFEAGDFCVTASQGAADGVRLPTKRVHVRRKSYDFRYAALPAVAPF